MSVWETPSGDPSYSLSFLGWNGVVYQRGGDLEPDIIKDGCKVGTNPYFITFINNRLWENNGFFHQNEILE